MSRPLETTDYLWVLSRQLDRVAEIATAYFNDASKKPAVYRAKAFIGSVLVLYSMTLPVLEEEGKVDITSLKENYRDLVKAISSNDPMKFVKTGLDAWSELIRALHISELLFRTGSTPIQV